jgi:TatD DNase family protein
MHTHSLVQPEGVLSIRSLHGNYSAADSGGFYSAGLHPWYLDDVAARWAELNVYAQLPNVIAIGECGLDRKCATPFSGQINAFTRQISLANVTSKPLIIHCVAAFSELATCLQKAIVPVILHGYNKKAAVAQQFLRLGCYFSFGKAILAPGSAARAFLAEVPSDRYFLETDDAGIDVRTLYAQAAVIRKTDEETIILQVRNNFKTVFAL